MKKTYLLPLFLLIFTFSCEESETIQLTPTQKIELLSKELEVDLQINDSVTQENSIIFGDVQEAKQFILKLKEAAEVQNQIFNAQEEKYRKQKKFKNLNFYCGNSLNGIYSGVNESGGGLTATHEFHASINNGNVTGLASWFTGSPIGIAYTLGVYHVTTSATDITINTVGTYTYNYFIGGVGTVYQETVYHRIRITCDGNVSVTTAYP